MPAAPGHASQAEDGHALDVHRQVHAVHQPRIDGRAGDAGDRNKEERAQILGGKSRSRQRAAERLLAEILRDFDPMIVGRAPAREPVIFFERERQVPRLHADAGLQTLQEHRVIHLRPPMFLQRLQQNALIVFVLRQRAGNTGDGHRGRDSLGYSTRKNSKTEFSGVEPAPARRAGCAGIRAPAHQADRGPWEYPCCAARPRPAAAGRRGDR
jgi:hypothetical protein